MQKRTKREGLKYYRHKRDCDDVFYRGESHAVSRAGHTVQNLSNTSAPGPERAAVIWGVSYRGIIHLDVYSPLDRYILL